MWPRRLPQPPDAQNADRYIRPTEGFEDKALWHATCALALKKPSTTKLLDLLGAHIPVLHGSRGRSRSLLCSPSFAAVSSTQLLPSGIRR